jgi:hypothetical protein
MSFSQNAIRATLALAALGIATAASAQGTKGFDGKWSVVIMTTKGDCDRAYRYPVAINGTSLVGDKSAMGSGHLTSDSGTGSWSGGSCAGTWTAERRS